MARRSVTIQELRRTLAQKEKQLGRLLARREKLAADLGAVDAEIAAMGGGASAPARPKRRKKKAAAKPKAPRRKAARRATKGKPLVEYIAKVLKKAEGGMRIKDIMPAVTKAGYVTKSKDFYGIVAAAVRDDARFKKLSRGVYALA